jgi:hypothetical protein
MFLGDKFRTSTGKPAKFAYRANNWVTQSSPGTCIWYEKYDSEDASKRVSSCALGKIFWKLELGLPTLPGFAIRKRWKVFFSLGTNLDHNRFAEHLQFYPLPIVGYLTAEV